MPDSTQPDDERYAALKRLHDMWEKTAGNRLGDLTKARDEIQRQDALLTQAYDHNTETQDERDRLAGELVNARVERDEYRERMNDLVDERDGLDGELTAARAEVERLTDERDKLAASLEDGTLGYVPAADLAEAYDALAAVNELHQPDTNSIGHEWCKTCRALWPCRTTKVIEGLAPVPGSSPRAPEPTDVTIRGVRVCLPDERRGADPDRPVRIVVAGVAYSDLNADEAREIAAALVAAAGESQASEPAGEAGRG